MNNISELQFFDLLSLKLSGDATAVELALLQDQLLQNPQWQFLYDQVMQYSSPLTDKEENIQQAYASHYVKMQLRGMLDEKNNTLPEAIETRSHKISLYHKLVYIGLMAASILGAVVFTRLNNRVQVFHNTKIAWNEIATKKGSKSNIKLPDGSMVWLNADSKLSYAENFIGKTREVTLTGEAYFDVVHDTAHPFIIHTGKVNIKVLGTAFNIRNYPEDKLLETTLMRGKIEITITGSPNEKIILKPLEKLIITKDSYTPVLPADNDVKFKSIRNNKPVITSATYSSVDSVVVETAWVNDKMVFINQSLGKIAQELERHFAVTVIFKNPLVKEYRYTGVFDNESLEKIMQLIQLSKKINYKILNKNLIIE